MKKTGNWKVPFRKKELDLKSHPFYLYFPELQYKHRGDLRFVSVQQADEFVAGHGYPNSVVQLWKGNPNNQNATDFIKEYDK